MCFLVSKQNKIAYMPTVTELDAIKRAAARRFITRVASISELMTTVNILELRRDAVNLLALMDSAVAGDHKPTAELLERLKKRGL